MLKLIFGLLCGVLYLIGLCFGWTYQETSVYVCIYLWPALCTMTTLPISVGLVHRIVINKGRWISLLALPFTWLYTACYITFTILVYTYYNDNIYSGSMPTIEQQFNMCMNDFQRIASACNTTYEEANIIIYVKLFILIVVVNGILAYITKPYHRKWNKLTAKLKKK